MKYKVGDRVKIKSLDWYNQNKDETDDIECSNNIWFYREMSKFCGKVMTISHAGVDYYTMVEDLVGYWTDEMIEGVEEETKPKFKVGDKITNGKVTLTILTLTPESYVVEDTFGECGTLYFNTKDDWKIVEEETPKFKVNDIVFVKNAGWVRITNSYWDSLANEYIYEAIGFDGKGEYDCINQSNIECQMLPESEPENPHIGGNRRTLEDIENEYEELTDRAFKGGYEKCKSDIELNGFQLPEGYIFKDENGNIINTNKIVLEKKTVKEKYSDVKIQIFGNVVILKGGINADNPTEYMNEVVYYIVNLLGNPKHNQFIEEYLDNPWVRILIFNFNSMEFNNSFDDIVTNFKH